MNPTRSILWLAGLGLASLAVVGTANAACTIDLSSSKSGIGHQDVSFRSAGLTAAVFHPDAAGGAHLIAVDDQRLHCGVDRGSVEIQILARAGRRFWDCQYLARGWHRDHDLRCTGPCGWRRLHGCLEADGPLYL